MNRQQIIPGNHTFAELEHIMRTASDMEDAGARIQFLSDHFLGTGYSGSTLIGDSNTREVFVVNLQRVDCMTFIEYIEAMRLSSSFSEFLAHLKKVRYKSGIIDFYARNHFFTDWKENNADYVEDITDRVGGIRTVCVRKKLNEKEDGTSFLQGIQPVIRDISYIPSEAVDREVIDKFKSGDYIGIFSHVNGLDVSHAGFIIRHDDIEYFRHASSQPEYRKVVDQDFREYVAGKPGIVVFRPKVQQ